MYNNNIQKFYKFLPFLLLTMLISCSPNLMHLIKAYEKAYNNHDLEGLMSLYAEDIRFEATGSFVKAGKEDVRDLTEQKLEQKLKIRDGA